MSHFYVMMIHSVVVLLFVALIAVVPSRIVSQTLILLDSFVPLVRPSCDQLQEGCVGVHCSAMSFLMSIFTDYIYAYDMLRSCSFRVSHSSWRSHHLLRMCVRLGLSTGVSPLYHMCARFSGSYGEFHDQADNAENY
jgi:hypothetical protein